MTKYRSSPLFLIFLAGCATSSGVPAPRIRQAAIAAAYIPLHKGGLVDYEGAAVAIAPGVAVTNAHNRNLLAAQSVLGESRGYDLLFFRDSDAGAPVAVTGEPRIGGAVIAYGQGAGGELRLAHGTVRQIESGDGPPAYFIFSGDAGPGFSGGPVLDGQGRLIGITFGYKDSGGNRLIYAYDMSRVMAEFSALPKQGPAGQN